jgi:hypothetical protein
MTATIPKNRFQLMARELQNSLKNGLVIPTEANLANVLQEMVDDILTREFHEMVTEFTNMAAKESDSGRRAGYFKVAKMLQSRIPLKPRTEPMPEEPTPEQS